MFRPGFNVGEKRQAVWSRPFDAAMCKHTVNFPTALIPQMLPHIHQRVLLQPRHLRLTNPNLPGDLHLRPPLEKRIRRIFFSRSFRCPIASEIAMSCTQSSSRTRSSFT